MTGVTLNFLRISILAVDGYLPNADETGLLDKAAKLAATVLQGGGTTAVLKKSTTDRGSAYLSRNTITLPSFLQILIDTWKVGSKTAVETLQNLFS
jgi:hypothetical protein